MPVLLVHSLIELLEWSPPLTAYQSSIAHLPFALLPYVACNDRWNPPYALDTKIARNGMAVIMSLCRYVRPDGTFGRISREKMSFETKMTPA